MQSCIIQTLDAPSYKNFPQPEIQGSYMRFYCISVLKRNKKILLF